MQQRVPGQPRIDFRPGAVHPLFGDPHDLASVLAIDIELPVDGAAESVVRTDRGAQREENSSRSIFRSTPGTRTREAGGFGSRLTLGASAGFGSVLEPEEALELCAQQHHDSAMQRRCASGFRCPPNRGQIDLVECLKPGEP